MIRLIVTFLVGAGVMLGAFLSGLAQRVPTFFTHYGEPVSVETQRTDTVLMPEDREHYGPLHARLAQPTGDVVDMSGAPAIVLDVESANGAGCAPVYRLVNDTDVPIALQSDAGQVEVPPGGAASPDSAMVPDDACGPVVRIDAESLR